MILKAWGFKKQDPLSVSIISNDTSVDNMSDVDINQEPKVLEVYSVPFKDLDIESNDSDTDSELSPQLIL